MWRVRGAVALALVAWLAGCQSETGFRPWNGEDDGDPNDNAGDDDPDPGGWGDWQPGSIPDLAIVLGVTSEDGYTSEVLVTDLRGRVLDTWTPPIDEHVGVPPRVVDVHALGPGQVLVATGSGGVWGFDKLTDRNALQVEPTATYSEVWHGDLVARTWTRVMHLDVARAALVVDATDRVLPIDLAQSAWAWQAAPFGNDPGRLLVSWEVADCSRGRSSRVLAVDTQGDGPEQFWALEQAWNPDQPFWTPELRGGVSADGDRVALALTRPLGCRGGGPPAKDTVMYWDLEQGPVELADDLPPGSTVRFDARTGAAMAVLEPTGTRGWGVRWIGFEGAVGALLDEAPLVQPISALDPEHGAALVAVRRDNQTDELVLIAGGRSVWTIDGVKQGLGSRKVTIHAGAVVPAP